MTQSRANAFHAGCEKTYQTKILPLYWAAKEKAARSGVSDDALPFVETGRALPDSADPQHKMYGPVVFVTSLDSAANEQTEGKPGMTAELFLRHAAEALWRGTHRISLPSEVLQWRREGEERKVAMQVMERKMANKKSLVLEDSGMPVPLVPGSAAPAGFSATVNGITVTAPSAEALQAVLAALSPATVAAGKAK